MDPFDITDPGFLAYMESEGLMDTDEGRISRVAKILNESPNEVIESDEFRAACQAAGVDPDSFIEADLEKLQQKLR